MNEPLIRIESDGKTVQIWKNGEKIRGTMVDFHFHAGIEDGIHISYEYENYQEDDNGRPIVKNNELVKERHIFDNRYERYKD